MRLFLRCSAEMPPDFRFEFSVIQDLACLAEACERLESDGFILSFVYHHELQVLKVLFLLF